MYLKHMRPYQLKVATEANQPLLVPAGCIETHGPHMALGHDTLIVEEICARIAARIGVVIAPSFDYGPTGYALGGPAEGTIDPDYDGFHRHVKGVLRNFLEMGFRRVFVIIMHQGMGGPLAQSFSKAASELSMERPLEKLPRGWWANPVHRDAWSGFGGIQVEPMILPASSPPAAGDHAGYNETSFLMATRPELVEQDRLDGDAPWYCGVEGDEQTSWSANVEHGQAMVDAVVDAWVARLTL
jgi:creatinine amidohydrolase